MKSGIEPSKLSLGLPTFGKKFRLTSDLHDLGSPATSVGSVPYTEVRKALMKYDTQMIISRIALS